MTQLVGKQEGHIQLRLSPAIVLSDDQLFELCQLNRELRVERTASGELVLMSPAGSESGARNASLTGQLWQWNRNTRLGQSFDSSTGFILPNGALRSPDAAWIRREGWEALRREQQQKFAPLCPDFVAELRSSIDRLPDLRAKLEEYIANGAVLGWLIDPESRRVWVYKLGLPVQVLDDPLTLVDEALPGFALDVQEVFKGC